MQRTSLPSYRVSIHATLAGGDRYLLDLFQKQTPFLSTPPSRVATRDMCSCSWVHSVSIHATLAGGDPQRGRHHGLGGSVSIHATLAGGDRCPLPWSFQSSCFYPRHPRGWRRAAAAFSSTITSVSIHATLAGGDVPGLFVCGNADMFLSTPPSRVATRGSRGGG